MAAISISAPVAAADEVLSSAFSPARIGTHDGALGRMIEVPDKRREQTFVAAIRCQTYVEIDGRLSDYLCVRDSMNHMDLRHQVQEAIKGTRFEPANVNGEPVKVYMNFMVGFKCEAGECEVVAAPHHGYRIPELGFEYTAPQIIVNEAFWDKPAWERESALEIHGARAGYVFFLSALIDVDGTASDVSIDYFDPAWHKEARTAAIYFERMTFIPGMHDGVATPMRATDFMGLGLRASGGPR